jgi:hypothetical protein
MQAVQLEPSLDGVRGRKVAVEPGLAGLGHAGGVEPLSGLCRGSLLPEESHLGLDFAASGG